MAEKGSARSLFVSCLCLRERVYVYPSLLDCGMVPNSHSADLQLVIDRQAIVIELLRARIGGFQALTSMIEAQEPLVPLGAAHEAILAEALAAGAA